MGDVKGGDEGHFQTDPKVSALVNMGGEPSLRWGESRDGTKGRLRGGKSR